MQKRGAVRQQLLLDLGNKRRNGRKQECYQEMMSHVDEVLRAPAALLPLDFSYEWQLSSFCQRKERVEKSDLDVDRKAKMILRSPTVVSGIFPVFISLSSSWLYFIIVFLAIIYSSHCFFHSSLFCFGFPLPPHFSSYVNFPGLTCVFQVLYVQEH